MADLVGEALGFADTLTRVVNGTFTEGAAFTVTKHASKPIAWVWPMGSTLSHKVGIPVTTLGDLPKLWLHAQYQVRLDDTQDFLAVERSVLSLCIDENCRPAVRIEFERDRGGEPEDERPGSHRRSAAHVQIHGVSAELTYALATTGQPPRPLEAFHIPVGGRRFRPTLEDFIEFLHMERLLPQLHEGWREVIAETRGTWVELQLRAAVRNRPDIASDQLRSMGWSVSEPDP